MTTSACWHLRRLCYSATCIAMWSMSVSAQEVSRTQCKQWDDAYLSSLNLFALLGLILPFVLNVAIPPALGRYFWFLTAPRLRIFIGSLIVFLVLTLISIAFPLLVGFGWFVFSGIDPAYFNCSTLRFGATGLVFGLVGPGTAAVGQWLAILGLLFVACGLGFLIAFVASKFLVARMGIHSLVRGGNK